MKKESTCSCPSCGRIILVERTRFKYCRPYISCTFCETFTWLDTGAQEKRTIHEAAITDSSPDLAV